MGWQGKILRVDLAAGTCEGEPLDMGWAGEYLGQRGLATKYLAEESDPQADPLSPANKLIFATGPLTGTPAATGGRWSVVTKGALTGAVACSNSGGQFGAELKFAGWDMVILAGKAPRPVYLLITDDDAELLAAGDLWGSSVWRADQGIRARHTDPGLRIAAIGRAGEAGVKFACVVNDLSRAAGRSGVGAVMGAKNLKAIAVRGTQGVALNDPERFLAAAAATAAKIDADGLTKSGTLPMLDVTQAFGALPTRNFQEVQFAGAGKVNAATQQAVRGSDGEPNLIANKACFACTIACGRISKIDPGHFSIAGKEGFTHASGGLEYESSYAFGPLLGIDDFEAMTYANFVCDKEGMDTISFGGALAAAMELFEVGALTLEDTGGVALDFGSAEALVAMVEATAEGKGFGAELGLGSKLLCEKYGRPELAMAVKGQDFPGYDGRAMPGMGLAFATSNRGACHLRASPYGSDFSGGAIEDKAGIVKDSQDRIAALDSSGLCAFPTFSLDHIASLLAPALGGEWTAQRLNEIGERIWNLERRFNLAAGLTADDDTLPKRLLLEPAKSGTGEGRVCELDRMLPEYYRLRGWNPDGEPTAKTLERLGL